MLEGEEGNPLQWPFVSVVIAVRNEERRIIQCLSSIEKMQYPGDYEVVVVDGESTDSTPQLLDEFCLKHRKFRTLKNPKKNVAVGRNIGIRESSGEIIAFTDGDITVHTDWLSNLVEALILGKSKLAGVGGPNLIAPSADFVERCIRFSVSTFWGSGRSIQYAYEEKRKYVKSISSCNASYWKHILIEMGGFNEAFFRGQDPELNLRLRKNGYLLEYVPDAKVFHFQDESLRSFVERMFFYGIARGMIMKKHPKDSVSHILLTGIGVALPIILLFHRNYLPHIFALYISASWISGVSQLLKLKWFEEFLLIPFFNFIEHFFYFMGIVIGILTRDT